jgi:lyso-ornithine lipid O-acyltransferase
VTERSFGDNARKLARLAALGGASVATLGLWELHGRIMADERTRARFRETYRKGWSNALLRSLGVEVVSDPPPPAGTRARLIVANHRSLLDVPVLLRHFGGRMLSKADVAEWPIAGPLAKHAETIFVDRRDTRSGASAIRAMRAALRDRSTLTVFPEGTVFAGDSIRPFQPGAFTAAAGLHVEIVPVALAYAPELEWGGVDMRTHVDRLIHTPRARVGLAVGDVIAATGSSRMLSELAQDAVQQLVSRARERANGR